MSYQHYVDHISAYEREFKPWESRVEKIVKRYRDDKRADSDGKVKFNVLWSNVQTLKAATFARTPMPDVSRRFRDNDPVGRVAALLVERALEFEVRHFRDYGATLGQCTYDRFLGGRGTAWVRYQPKFAVQVTEDVDTDTPAAEELEDENVPVDYVHWRDFGHAIARTWEECTLVWRKVYMTQREADERFPDVKLPCDTMPDNQKDGSVEKDAVNMRALVYELWDKEAGKAVWLSKAVGKIIDEKDDPLGLEEFFPCPPPIYATLTTESLIPVPDFTLYQDQANELDILADKIDGLVKALQMRGVYDASVPELARLFTEAGNTELIPVTNWAALAEKKGLGGAIDLIEILPIAQALAEAYKAFDQIKNQIYELTGISDILRGETAPSETATAQQIKNSYASLRLKVFQDEVEKFATRLLQLKAEIICNHFEPETITRIACAEAMSQADRQLIPQALQMLKSGVTRAFRIEIATDSMVYQDEQQEKQTRMEFLQAVGGYVDIVAKTAQGMPDLLPMAVEMLKFAVTGFRVGKGLEGTIDQAVEQMKAHAAQAAQQPKPNPDAIKAQAAQQSAQIKAQADQQTTQMSEQAETQRHQMSLQADAQARAQDQTHQAQLEAIKAQNTHASEQMREQHERAMATFQAQQAQRDSQLQAMLQQLLQDKKSATAIEVAEIGAETTLDAAQISAAKTAESA